MSLRSGDESKWIRKKLKKKKIVYKMKSFPQEFSIL